MREYAMFVKGIIEAISEAKGSNLSLTDFAEGPFSGEFCTTLQDAAMLTGENAYLFYLIVHNCVKIFDMELADFPVEYTRLVPIQEKYLHSCYPKNLRRWMEGTLPRKKKCRVELVVLTACWASGWSNPIKETQDCILCRSKITNLCAGILHTKVPEASDMESFVRLLWKASQEAYMHDCCSRK